MPPIRTENDNKAVWNALSKNRIDTIGTDHVANQLKLKLAGDDVWGALAGFPGIGTVIPILLNDGVNQNRITLEQFVQLTSKNAAQIFGMYPQKGTLEKNSDADITMIDLKKEKNQDGLSAWSNSRSPEFEAKAIKTVSKYGRDYDCVIYFAHIGSERALAQIEE